VRPSSVALLAVVLFFACSRGNEEPAASSPLADVALPVVASHGTVAAELGEAILVATPSAITVNRTQVLALSNGVINAADKESDGSASRAPKLVTALGSLQSTRSEVLALALDRRLTYRLFCEVFYSARQKGADWRRFALLVRTGTMTLAFPFEVPQTPPVLSGGLSVHDLPRLFVTYTAKELLLWSADGREGTMDRPKLRAQSSVPGAASKLSAALAEIVRRRWGPSRPQGSHTIVLAAEPDTTMQTVAELLGAIRSTPGGIPLFRDIQLSSGFE
jgi:hypothetical protein